MISDFVLCRLFPNTGTPLLEQGGTGLMEGDWDTRARLNPIMAATGESTEARAVATAHHALEATILRGIGLNDSSVVLEIGCGVGNLLRPLSRMVKEAHGVDISGEMLRRAHELSGGYANVFYHKTSGRLGMFANPRFDFVYSSGVFIHFPEKALVYAYTQEAHRVLKAGGTLRIHIDGRNYLWWRRQKGGTVRGIVFAPKEIVTTLTAQGFTNVSAVGEDSPAMWVTAQRP
jgi:SAM-dependent methyltransferase